MKLEDVYGTRPDLLPRSMVRLVRADRQGDPRSKWVGRSGVKLLSLAQHQRNERESLGRYPRNSDGAIEWSVVPEELVLSSTNRDLHKLDAIARKFTSDVDSIILFWGSLAIPSVELSRESFLAKLPDVLDSNIAEFWMYSPNDGLVLECSFFGVVTLARIPTVTDGRTIE